MKRLILAFFTVATAVAQTILPIVPDSTPNAGDGTNGPGLITILNANFSAINAGKLAPKGAWQSGSYNQSDMVIMPNGVAYYSLIASNTSTPGISLTWQAMGLTPLQPATSTVLGGVIVPTSGGLTVDGSGNLAMTQAGILAKIGAAGISNSYLATPYITINGQQINLGTSYTTPAIPVPTVFGRVGSVVGATGDYTAAQVTNAVDSTQTYSNPAWLTGLAWSKLSSLPALTNTFNGRSGTVVPATGDYAASQVTNAVDATGSYSNPAWLTALAFTKLTGVPSLVNSFNGRIGAIIPATADYTAAQVSNALDATQTYSNPGWLSALAWSKITGAPSFITANQTITISGDASGSGTTAITLNVSKLNGTSLAGLGSCLLFNTTGTGVPSCASAGQILAALGSIPNASLTNPGLTINGTFVPLGSSVTVTGGGGGTYSLPIASSSVLGGVKVGTGGGLAIDGSGTLTTTGGGGGTWGSITGTLSAQSDLNTALGLKQNAGSANSNNELPLMFSAPLSRTSNTVSILAATGSIPGYLTAADWATFNAKQPALGFTPQNASSANTNNELPLTFSADFTRTSNAIALAAGTKVILPSGTGVLGISISGADPVLLSSATLVAALGAPPSTTFTSATSATLTATTQYTHIDCYSVTGTTATNFLPNSYSINTSTLVVSIDFGGNSKTGYCTATR